MSDKKRAAEQPHEGTGICLSREDELLVHCARLDLFQGRRKAAKYLLAEGLDWDLLLDRAAWHQLSPLVSYHLRTPDLSVFVPRLVLEKLQRLNYQSLARNMLLQDELSHLLAAFNEEGIPVIVLKGAALLGSIYRDIGLRPMGDLDILVQREHLDRAEAIASFQGYAPIADRDAQEHTTMNCRHLPNLIHLEKGTVLEIHQHIVDSNSPYHFDLSGFWARAQPVTMSGAGALTLAPEDLLIHLSINFLFDRRYRSNSALGQLCDISEVILHYGDSLNWNLIEEVAQKYGIAPGLHCVFYACEQLLRTQVPASALRKFQPREFNPTLACLFLRRRVLDARPWLAHGLVAPQLPYSRRRVLRAIVGRFFHVPAEILKKHGLRTNAGTFYLRRMKDILPRLGRVLLRPSELKEDLLLDRWLHDLCGSTTRTQLPDSRSKYKAVGGNARSASIRAPSSVQATIRGLILTGVSPL